VKKVRAWIDGHFSRLRVVETSYCNVPLEILLSVGSLVRGIASVHDTLAAVDVCRQPLGGVPQCLQ
jgi:hypothetical protein